MLFTAPQKGSSPLARGTPLLDAGKVGGGGLIPARAGNTPENHQKHSSGRAHPRSRGEHKQGSTAAQTKAGSSPLARGTRKSGIMPFWNAGLIPARAGNTFAKGVAGSRAGAHPRSRGEHAHRRGLAQPCTGSSPLARGTRSTFAEHGSFFGLIPARAGNTNESLGVRGLLRAHPRSRGEHSGSNPPILRRTGSSPLARGTHGVNEGEPLTVGLIPARAGNTSGSQRLCSPFRAHPRSRGEHSRIVTLHALATGSSPLARGTQSTKLASS